MTPNKEALTIEPKNGQAFTLEEAQALVGGWVEIVRLNDRCIMLVDEEGLCKEKLYNPQASQFASANNPWHQKIDIVGTAIVCTDKEF